MSENSDQYVRPEQTEKAFRRFEEYIALAMATVKRDKDAVYKVNTRECGTPMSPLTFCSRFNDAKLAFKRFGYKSKLIPADFDTDSIVCRIANDNEVAIHSKGRRTDRTVRVTEYVNSFPWPLPAARRDLVDAVVTLIKATDKHGMSYLETTGAGPVVFELSGDIEFGKEPEMGMAKAELEYITQQYGTIPLREGRMVKLV